MEEHNYEVGDEVTAERPGVRYDETETISREVVEVDGDRVCITRDQHPDAPPQWTTFNGEGLENYKGFVFDGHIKN